MSLTRYRKKRDFTKTPEPKGKRIKASKKRLFLIQKHAASHLHYDFRLELHGVLKSWAIPKGPSLDPAVKRLAVHVEDHPIEYGDFEGIIPPKQYGAGTVMLWDKGEWQSDDPNPYQAYLSGNMTLTIIAKKLHGRFKLIRTKAGDKSWLLFKIKDQYAKPTSTLDITLAKTKSVVSNKTMEEIAKNYDYTWDEGGAKKDRKKKAKTLASTRDPNPLKIKLKLPIRAYPKQVYPALATLVDSPPEGKSWLHEIKLDGYRMIAFKHGSSTKMITRNQNDWSNKFKDIIEAINTLPIKDAVFDGEVVVLDENGHSNFQQLQNSLKENQGVSIVYYLFDLIYYDQYDLSSLPLIERKNILHKIIPSSTDPILRYSDHIIGSGKRIFKKICELKLEGLISKDALSPYWQKRTRTWLKIKCLKRQEFVIGGFTKPQGRRQHFGSLLLGTFNKRNELIYNGNVGTGFTEISLDTIYKRLKQNITNQMPFKNRPSYYKGVTWLNPVLIAEVEFSSWTKDNVVRHPSFKGLRDDKQAENIIKEYEEPVENVVEKPKKLQQRPAYKFTNPNKILFPEDRITKKDLAEYYETIAAYILPYITDRLLTMVRCPEGYRQACFYQKHINQSTPSDLYGMVIQENESKENCIYIKDIVGLIALVQISALEIHPWGSSIRDIEYPDIITFDLDPGPNVKWSQVVKAAFAIRKLLMNINLKSFVKSTGGKGLHVVLPIKPQYEWNEIKIFTRVVADFLVQQNPIEYIDKMTKAKRTGKIYIDYLRNQRGATAIAPYATRARPHAPIAAPLHWDELSDNFEDTYFTFKTILNRIKHLRTDPWRGFFNLKQSLNLEKLAKS